MVDMTRFDLCETDLCDIQYRWWTQEEKMNILRFTKVEYVGGQTEDS